MTIPEQADSWRAAGEQPPVLVHQVGRMRWLRLNRPSRRNALTPELISRLDEALVDAEADRATAVVVIAGAGPSFCAGADLRHLLEIAEAGKDPLEFLTAVSACFSRIERATKPVVAAVHGHVVAGGLELALACDVVVAQAGTLIGDGHIRNGLLPGGGASLRLPRKVGEPLARWLMLTGELLPAERFVAGGFVHAVVPVESFDSAVASVADRLSGASAQASARVKRLLHHGPRSSPRDTALARELEVFAEHWQDSDIAGPLSAFFQRNGNR